MFLFIRALTYTSLFVGVLLVFIPSRLLSWFGMAQPATIGAAQITGMLAGVAGATIAMWCAVTFARDGKGTLMPLDPPRRLVVRGPYRFVRNPMYLGTGLALLGGALFFASLPILLYAVFFLAATHLFVFFFEEPTLRRNFGAEYEAYCKQTQRWWPRLWNKALIPAGHYLDPSLVERIDAMISRAAQCPVAVRILVCSLLLLSVAVLDIVTGSELSFSLFYLLPVTAATLIGSRQIGEKFALVSAIAWGLIEVAGREYSAMWIPIWNSAVRLGFFIVVVELLAAMRQAHQCQSELARTDSLTGIPNARVFNEAVKRTLAQCRRSGEPFSVAYIDLDRFKQVNDTLGHSEGDKLLRFVATAMRDTLRSTDTLARLGGDEFAILFTGSGNDDPLIALERIRSAVAHAIEERWSVGMTIGLMTFIDPPADPDAVIQAVDALMYAGKSAGRGMVIHEKWSVR